MIIFTLCGKTGEKEALNERGEITGTAEDYDWSLEYEPQSEDEVVESASFVVVENIDKVFGILSLQAIGKLEEDLSKYLAQMGFDDSELIYMQIDERSIIADRSYPYFELSAKGISDDAIKASYLLDTYEWKFE